MTDKIFGLDFTDEPTPTGASTISVNNGANLVDVQLLNLHKALTQTTDSQAGTIELATSLEVQQGADAVRAVTPATLRAEMDFHPSYNYLINGGFDFAQRQIPGTLTTIADNKYSADRWRVTRENADVQYIRVDATGETGLTSRYYGQFKKITNAGKIHIVQIVEGINSVPLRGKTVIFQAKMKASSAKTIRMAVLELQNAGTIDTIPATLVTAFGANGVDPTLGANVAVITAAQSKNVTSAWGSFSLSVTVPSNSKNLLCAIWTDSQYSANDTLSIAEAGLFTEITMQLWTPRIVAEELRMCKRYCERTDAATGLNIAAGFADTTANMLAFFRFESEKFTTATCSFGTAVGDFSIRYAGAAVTTATAVSFTSPSTQGVTITVVGTGTPLTAGQGCQLRCVNANGYLLFEAEL